MVKRLLLISLAVFLLTSLAVAEENFPPPRDGSGVIGGQNGEQWRLGRFEGLDLNDVEYAFPAADGTNGYQLTTDGAGTLTWAGAGGAGSTAWDDILSPDANDTISFSTYTAVLSGAQTAGDGFTFQNTGDFGDISVLKVQQVTGNPTDGTVLEVVAADANTDPLVVSASGKANALVVGQDTGVVTIAGVAEGTDALVLTAGDITLTDGDVNVDGGDATFAEDVTVSGLLILDNGLTIDNSSNNVLEINENSEEFKLTFASNVVDLSSTSGVNQLDYFDNAAATLTHAADNSAEDFTVSQTGAQDASLVLSSTGTGADALQISTSAGGIDIAVVGSAAGEDLDLDSDSSINLTASEAGVADAVVIQTDGAGSGIDITSLADIDITTTGAAGEDITIDNNGGSINIVADENQANSIVIDAENAAGGIDVDAGTGGIAVDITGAADFRVDSSAGSIVLVGAEAAADAVTIDAENAAGGIDVDAGTGGIAIDITGAADFRVDSSAGSIVLVGAEAAADAVTIDAENAAGGIDVDYGTGGMAVTGTGDAAFTLDADDGSIDFTDSSNISITSSEAAEDLTISQIGANDSSIIITSAGTGTDALTLETSNAAGDIDINAGDAITVDAGDIVVTTDDTAANQFKVDATGAIAGNAIVFETTDGGIQLNADGATGGDIDIDAADDITVTAAGDLTFAVTGTVSMGNTAVTSADMDYENVSAANVITEAEGNKVFFIGDATEFASTLPDAASSAGMHIVFVVTAAPSGASYTIVTEGSENTIIGGVVERETDTGDDGPYLTAADTVTFVDSVAVVGDTVEFWCNGTNWYMIGQVNADGAVTVTQAS